MLITGNRLKTLPVESKSSWFHTGLTVAAISAAFLMVVGFSSVSQADQMPDSFFRGAPDGDIIIEEFSDFT